MKTEALNKSIQICNLLGDSVNKKIVYEYTPDEFAVWFSEYHNLSALFCSALNYYGIVGGEAQRIELLSDKEIFKQLKSDALQEKICKLFSENGIAHMVLKGTRTRKFYPEYLIRTSNDIDLYVKPDDIAAASGLLKNIGLECVICHDGDAEFAMNGSYVELHTSLGGFTKKQKRFWNSVASEILEQSEKNIELSNDDCYIYSVFHLYKHFITAGSGARMFLDVYCIGKTQGLDDQYIKTSLKNLGLLDFEEKVSEINGVLFEGKAASEEILELLEFVFKNGAFGSGEAAKYLKYAGTQVTGQKNIRHVMQDLCLDFGSMKKRYKILNKVAVLYPFCVVHRFLKGRVFRKKTLKNVIKSEKENFVQSEHYSRILKISGII